MRYQFAKALEKISLKDKKTVFMTGDLGFNLFEPLEKILGDRFIDAGVAEHNMVTVAAGMAYSGLKPWIYSIASFITIKVLEELRNDVCFPNLNVKVVGLGGGYDYAIAGPTHHVLQDIAVMLTLPNMKIYTPGFVEDVEAIVNKMNRETGPSYLRLTKAEGVKIKITPYAPVRRILRGNKLTLIVLGSMVNRVVPAISDLKVGIIDLWLVSELPFGISKDLAESIIKTQTVCVIEEHLATGGLGHYFNHLMIEKGINFKKFIHLYAKGYKSHLYGSRDFYLKENRLDKESIKKEILNILND